MKTFETKEEIWDYIKIISENDIQNEAIFVDNILPIFASSLLDDPETFLYIQSCFYTETNYYFPHIILKNIDKLFDTTISFYKFCVLCGLRGPTTLEGLEKQVALHKTSGVVSLLVKHKDFPSSLKKKFFEWTGNPDYLPQEAQDMFIF